MGGGGGGGTMKVLRVKWVRRRTQTSMGTLRLECRIVGDYEGTVQHTDNVLHILEEHTKLNLS